MFARILVPINLTDASSWKQALPVAISLAQASETRLTLATVLPHWISARDADWSWEADRRLEDPDTHSAALGSLLERARMPLGPELCLTGRLAEGPFGLELHSGGGVWELETGRGARRLLGREVEVCGRRAGFNELICDQIWPAGQPRPPRSKFNIELLLAGSVVGYGLITFFLGLVGRLG